MSISLKSLAKWFACGFGSGYSSVMPGTVGSLVAVPFYLVLSKLAWPYYLALILLMFVAGIYLCASASKQLGAADPGAIVWDEMVGIWIAFWPTHGQLRWMLVAFVLFRLFDILKIWPACWVDKHVKSGFGIMLDDAVAAMYTVLSLGALQAAFG